MISNPFKSFSKILWVLALVATFIPMATLAAEPTDLGKITIDVRDENGVRISGDWYLHQGSTEKNLVVRNGTKGETFNFPAGTYFLEVRNLKTHPFRKIFTVNPQALVIGGSIQYKIQYFKTEEQWADAKIPTSVLEPVVQETAPVVVVPEPDLDPELIPTPTPTRPTLVNNHIKLNIVRPAEVDPWIEGEPATENQDFQLAVTGPEGILGALSLLSLASGLWIVKRKNS